MGTTILRAATAAALLLSFAFAVGCSTSPPSRPTGGTPGPVTPATATPGGLSSGVTAATPTSRPASRTPAPPRPTSEEPRPSPSVLGNVPAANGMVRAHGVVKAVQKDKRTLDVQHDAVPSLGLQAGTTHFSARSFEVVTDVGPGDEIDFDIVREKNVLVIVDAVPMSR